MDQSLIFPIVNSVAAAVRAAASVIGKDKKHKDAINIHTASGEESIAHHLKYVSNWCSTISVGAGIKQLNLTSAFVKLRLQQGRVTALRARTNTPSIEPESILAAGEHAVVLGEPGAGKTTLVKHICHSILTTHRVGSGDDFEFPILLLMRQLSPIRSIAEELLAILGTRVVAADAAKPEHQESAKDARERLLEQICNQKHILIILDGLDELDPLHRQRVTTEISRISCLLEKSQLVVTCRFGAMIGTIDGASVYAIEPFAPADRLAFVQKWFQDDAVAQKFSAEIETKIYYDTTQTPLHLANLCLLFEAQGKLPNSSIRVSEKIVDLRLEQWDRERGLTRGSYYADFGPDEKRRFLASLSWHLASAGHIGIFSERSLRTAYDEVTMSAADLSHLRKAQATTVITEIESHSGLIMQTADHAYEFYHLTIFEYLCADYISRCQVDLMDFNTLVRIPEAIAVAGGLSAAVDNFFLVIASRSYEAADSGHAFIDCDFWMRIITRCRTDGVALPVNEKIGCMILIAAAWPGVVKRQTSRGGSRRASSTAIDNDLDLLLRDFISTHDLVRPVLRAIDFYYVHGSTGDLTMLTTDIQRVCGTIAIPKRLSLPSDFLKWLSSEEADR